MAIEPMQKLKILYVMKVLLEETDEQHSLTAEQIIGKLKAYGISAERKSIYSDIDSLIMYGIDIGMKKEKPAGYYVMSRQFELPELKLLVDAVQSAKFITVKKSNELISRLESLVSKNEASLLQRQVFVNHRVKTMNESIYYNVDAIHEAINNNRRITFTYWEWTVKKEMRLRKEGKRYEESPWLLSWDDENYYLIAYDHEDKRIKHFRVDKMKDIEIAVEKREGKLIFKNVDLAAYAKKTFGMFGGEDSSIQIVFPNELIGAVIDRFGTNIPIIPIDEKHFKANVVVAISTQFFGWLVGLGEGVKLVAPEDIIEQFKNHLDKVLKYY